MPSHAVSTSTTATPVPTATPSSTTGQASPAPTLPPGVTVVDTANVIQRLDWSPNGKLLAVLTWGGTLGNGRADVVDLAGRQVASFDAFDMAWVDDTHLMTLVVTPDDTAHGTVTVHALDGQPATTVTGTYGGILGNGHGSVALTTPNVPSDAPLPESFRVWSNGKFGPMITGRGTPLAWSPDGGLLALLTSRAYPAADLSRPGTAAMYSVGGSLPGTLIVMKVPTNVVSLARKLGDIRINAYFSPDGTKLVTSDGLLLDLANGGSTQVPGNFGGGSKVDGWHSGALITVGVDGSVSLWTATGTTIVPDAYDEAVFGPNEGEIVTMTAPSDNLAAPSQAVVRRGSSSVTLALNVGWTIATWSTGGICFIATGTRDAQVVGNRLLRVELPAD